MPITQQNARRSDSARSTRTMEAAKLRHARRVDDVEETEEGDDDLAEHAGMELSEADLNAIADGIESLCKRFVGSAKTALRRRVELGVALVKAQAQIGHGRWVWFVKHFLPFSVKTAERLQQLGENPDRALSEECEHLSPTAALKLLAPPRKRKDSAASDGSEQEADANGRGDDHDDAAEDEPDDDGQADADSDAEEDGDDDHDHDENEEEEGEDEEGEEEAATEAGSASIHPYVDMLLQSGYWTFDDASPEFGALSSLRETLTTAALEAAGEIHGKRLARAGYSVADIAEALVAYLFADTEPASLVAEV